MLPHDEILNVFTELAKLQVDIGYVGTFKYFLKRKWSSTLHIFIFSRALLAGLLPECLFEG